MQLQATKNNDHEANEMLRYIALVPIDTKIRIFKFYVRKCRDLHSVAFFQWRMKYPSKIRFDKEEIEECIEKRLKYFSKKEINTKKDRDRVS